MHSCSHSPVNTSQGRLRSAKPSARSIESGAGVVERPLLVNSARRSAPLVSMSANGPVLGHPRDVRLSGRFHSSHPCTRLLNQPLRVAVSNDHDRIGGRNAWQRMDAPPIRELIVLSLNPCKDRTRLPRPWPPRLASRYGECGPTRRAAQGLWAAACSNGATRRFRHRATRRPSP